MLALMEAIDSIVCRRQEEVFHTQRVVQEFAALVGITWGGVKRHQRMIVLQLQFERMQKSEMHDYQC